MTGDSWEMGLTEGELLRVLGTIPACRHARLEEGLVRVPLSGGEVILRYAALPDRVIGTVRLPATRVETSFHDVTEAERQTFLRAFRLHFLRAGG